MEKKIVIKAIVEDKPLSEDEKEKIRKALQGSRIQELAVDKEGVIGEASPQALSDMIDLASHQPGPKQPTVA